MHNNSSVLWMHWLLAGGFISRSVRFKKGSSWKRKRQSHAFKRGFRKHYFSFWNKSTFYLHFGFQACWNLTASSFKFWACGAGLCVDMAQMAKNGSCFDPKTWLWCSHPFTVLVVVLLAVCTWRLLVICPVPDTVHSAWPAFKSGSALVGWWYRCIWFGVKTSVTISGMLSLVEFIEETSDTSSKRKVVCLIFHQQHCPCSFSVQLCCSWPVARLTGPMVGLFFVTVHASVASLFFFLFLLVC